MKEKEKGKQMKRIEDKRIRIEGMENILFTYLAETCHYPPTCPDGPDPNFKIIFP